MQGETKERWLELCVQAVFERDPKKLLEISEEINRLLREEQERLKKQHSKPSEG